MKPQRASYSDFARRGFGAGLLWASLYLALDYYIARNERSALEMLAQLAGHGLIFMSIGLFLARCINWMSAQIDARNQATD